VKISATDRWARCLGLEVVCIFLAGYAWAQTPAANQPSAQSPDSTATAPVATAPVATAPVATAPVTTAPVAQPTMASANKPHDDSFIIGNDDVLAISVWKEPELSKSIPVRSDGRISLPLLGDVQAAGLTPLKLEQDIATKLQPYIAVPEVAVIVEQINSQKFNILGKVMRPGTYPLTNSATVLDAIALAGGCRDFAKQGSIYILRRNPDGSETRIPFNYKAVIKGKKVAQNISLQPHDTIVVP